AASAVVTLAVFVKLSYRAWLGTEQTLAFRFVIAAIGMWCLALALRQNPMRLGRLELLTLVALGALFYTGQSLAYFTALRTLPASRCVLIASVSPTLV